MDRQLVNRQKVDQRRVDQRRVDQRARCLSCPRGLTAFRAWILCGVFAGTMAAMKETELWERLRLHLGAGYFRVWASEYSLAELGQRTVVQALADGVPCKIIWRAVWAALELPARDR
jgi:Protein of unknown function (DUF3046)